MIVINNKSQRVTRDIFARFVRPKKKNIFFFFADDYNWLFFFVSCWIIRCSSHSLPFRHELSVTWCERGFVCVVWMLFSVTHVLASFVSISLYSFHVVSFFFSVLNWRESYRVNEVKKKTSDNQQISRQSSKTERKALSSGRVTNVKVRGEDTNNIINIIVILISLNSILTIPCSV